jgi:hypothetical protein
MRVRRFGSAARISAISALIVRKYSPTVRWNS